MPVIVGGAREIRAPRMAGPARGAADVLSSLFVQQPSGYDVTGNAYRIDGGRIVENRDYAMSTLIVLHT